MATRHVIVGGGTAGHNAIVTLRQEEAGSPRSEIVLVASERPYSRMVLPYYLGRTIAESHVFTVTPARLAELGVTAHLGRRAAALDPRGGKVTLDDGTVVEFDDLLIATGSSPVRPRVPGADGPGVHSFWTLEQARRVVAEIRPGSHVVMVGAGFIAFTILNAVLALGATLTIVEIAPQILPRMIDQEGAALVERWLTAHGVKVRTGATLTGIDQARGKRRLTFEAGRALEADVVIMATGIRTNLDWLVGSGIQVNRGVVVDDHLRSSTPNVYAAGDVAEGRDLVTGAADVHAIEPTAMEHGRVVGANMAGRDVAYRGSLLMNILDVCHLDVASFGRWDDPAAETVVGRRPDRQGYRKLLFHGDRLTGAMIVGRADDVWTTNDVGQLKGLVQTGVALGRWRDHLARSPFDVKPAFIASRTTGRLIPQTVLGRPSPAPQVVWS
jgi:NAD(P)H-nitrite reductase large subunit